MATTLHLGFIDYAGRVNGWVPVPTLDPLQGYISNFRDKADNEALENQQNADTDSRRYAHALDRFRLGRA